MLNWWKLVFCQNIKIILTFWRLMSNYMLNCHKWWHFSGEELSKKLGGIAREAKKSQRDRESSHHWRTSFSAQIMNFLRTQRLGWWNFLVERQLSIPRLQSNCFKIHWTITQKVTPITCFKIGSDSRPFKVICDCNWAIAVYEKDGKIKKDLQDKNPRHRAEKKERLLTL